MDSLVTIKSCKYGMEIYLDPEVSFDVLMEHIRVNSAAPPGFSRGLRLQFPFWGAD